MNIITSSLGRYEAGNPDLADVVIGYSFGTSIQPGSPNHAMGNYIEQHANGRPVIVDRTLADALPKSVEVAHVVEGPVTNIKGQGVGTWGTLVEAKEFMDQNELKLAMQVGQAHHIGRISMQAKKAGIDSILPPDLPGGFDPNSKQIWTRSLGLWVPFNIGGSVLLKAKGQL